MIKRGWRAGFFRRGAIFRALIAVSAWLAVAPAGHAAPPAVTIDWRPASLRLLQPGATYGRMERAADGAVLCAFERGGRSWVMRGDPAGRDWAPPMLLGSHPAGTAANPELCALEGGTVLGFYNERPAAAGGPHRFTIRMAASRDGGRSWQLRPQPVFAAGNTAGEGCWEPAAVQLPDGEVRLMFARELPGEQEIAMMSSRDEGATWRGPTRASLRPGRRDGMPVPALLAGGRLVCAIEDNGLAGLTIQRPPFRPSIVAVGAAAGAPPRWPALAAPPRAGANIAAPYLVRLPGGETLLSAQSNEDDLRDHRMVVYPGDREARNFAGRTLPFGARTTGDCLWNSLFVRDAETVIALSDARIGGRRGLWCIEGRVVRAR